MKSVIVVETNSEVRVYQRPKPYKGAVTYIFPVGEHKVDTRKLTNDEYKRALTLGLEIMIKSGEIKPE